MILAPPLFPPFSFLPPLSTLSCKLMPPATEGRENFFIKSEKDNQDTQEEGEEGGG